MRNFTRYIIALSTVLPIMAVMFDRQTDLANQWTNNRPAVEAKMKANHTGLVQGIPVFYSASYDSNVTAVDRYTKMVKDSK